jgi:hypothetical protein
MLAAGRGEVARLNELARDELQESGLLGPNLVVVDSRGFAAGDKVVCLRNDRRLGVLNGTVGTVERWDGGALLVGTSEGPRLLPAAYLEAGDLGHAYALTIHKAQGMTVERAFVLSSESLSRESGYVAMSRATESTELFVPLDPGIDEAGHDPRGRMPGDPLSEVARRLAVSRAKQLALFEAESAESAGEQDPALRRSLRSSDGDDVDPSDQRIYGDRRAVTGSVDGNAVSGSQLFNGDEPDRALSEIERRLEESRRRISAALSRRGWSRSLVEPERSPSRGLGR